MIPICGMRPIIIHNRFLPWGDYRAVTLFPFVFYKGEVLTEREVRHETIHLWQQATLLILPFYVLYLLFWIAGLLRYRNQYHAYRSIPFERSAYDMENMTDLRRMTMAFDWIHRLSSDK